MCGGPEELPLAGPAQSRCSSLEDNVEWLAFGPQIPEISPLPITVRQCDPGGLHRTLFLLQSCEGVRQKGSGDQDVG